MAGRMHRGSDPTGDYLAISDDVAQHTCNSAIRLMPLLVILGDSCQVLPCPLTVLER
jgi:hypothetical protein